MLFTPLHSKLVGAIIQRKGVSFILYIAQAVHKCEGESGGRADLLLSATDKERVQGKLKHGGGRLDMGGVDRM